MAKAPTRSTDASNSTPNRKGSPPSPEKTTVIDQTGLPNQTSARSTGRAKAHTEPLPSRPRSAVDEAALLAKEFDVPVRRAAELVSSKADDVTAIGLEASKKLRSEDPLAGVPIPEEPAEQRAGDNEEEGPKPILHVRNDRGGAG